MATRKLTALIATRVMDHPPQRQPIDFAAGERFAQQVAADSAVLLKNAELLPLSRRTARIAVIGRLADRAMLSGGGSSQVLSPGGPAYSVNPNTNVSPCPEQPGPGPSNWCEVWVRSSPLQAIKAAAPAARVDFADGSDVAAAAALAANSDVVVLMAHQWATEGRDLESLTLRSNQDALIAAVAAVNPRTVVVLQSGNPVLMPWLGQVGAVIQQWYAGIRGAQALADILFGKVNPSGKLPMSFPARETETPTGGGAFATTDVPYTEGLQIGYRWYDAQGIAPLFPFGHGLSYTRFTYADAKVSEHGTTLSFTLRNAGRRAGAEVAQVYVQLPSGVGEPPKRLVGWKKVELEAGESRKVTLKIARDRLAFWDSGAGRWQVAPGSYQFLVGASSRDIRLQETVTLR
jgi:beta-glucosidase